MLNQIDVGDQGIDATADVLLQLDVFGSEAQPDRLAPRPADAGPQVIATDDNYANGVAGLLYNEDDFESVGVFRFAQASSLRIIDLLAGDANGDGSVDLRTSAFSKPTSARAQRGRRAISMAMGRSI
ncbi:MAG: hypothetical protein U0836_06490 [Pirellulales bacterium]